VPPHPGRLPFAILLASTALAVALGTLAGGPQHVAITPGAGLCHAGSAHLSPLFLQPGQPGPAAAPSGGCSLGVIVFDPCNTVSFGLTKCAVSIPDLTTLPGYIGCVVSSAITGALSAVWNAINSLASQVAQFATNIATAVAAAISNGVSYGISQIGNFFVGIGATVTSFISGFFNLLISSLNQGVAAVGNAIGFAGPAAPIIAIVVVGAIVLALLAGALLLIRVLIAAGKTAFNLL
jgi:hypothetical protein